MAEPTTLSPVTDRSPFSLHPEDWVTQRDSRDEQTYYFKHGLRWHLPDCFVARDLAVYWVPGQTQHPYVGPDNFIAHSKPRVEDPTVWLTYEDGPLALVIEVASEATRDKEAAKRDEIYARALRVPEYVYLDLQLGERRLIRWHELGIRSGLFGGRGAGPALARESRRPTIQVRGPRSAPGRDCVWPDTA